MHLRMEEYDEPVFEKEEEVEVEEKDYDDSLEAAYLTTGLLTAAKARAEAHLKGAPCSTHHHAVDMLLATINGPSLALAVIDNLLEVSAIALEDDEVAAMIAAIVAQELEDDD